jgi:VanZ family protein
MFSKTCKLALLAYAVLLLYAGWMPLSINGNPQRLARELRRAVAPSPQQCLVGLRGSDGCKNLLLFAPLGALLIGGWKNRPRWLLIPAACAAALVVSLTIETGQLFIVDRVADVRDVVSNSLGGMAGAVAAAILIGPAHRAASVLRPSDVLPRDTASLRMSVLLLTAWLLAVLTYLTWDSSGGQTPWPLWGLYRHEFGWAYYDTIRRWAVCASLSALTGLYVSLRCSWPLRYRMLAGAAVGAFCAAALEAAKMLVNPHGGSVAILLENTAAAMFGAIFFAWAWRFLDRRRAASSGGTGAAAARGGALDQPERRSSRRIRAASRFAAAHSPGLRTAVTPRANHS